MPSAKSVLDFLLDQLSGVPDVRVRPMMGEYLLCVGGKLVGGLYDDRLLLTLLPRAPLEKPYEGGADMLLFEDTDDRELLSALVTATAAALPEPKRKK